jgi:large subunit ribosomal protein L24
MSKWIKKDDQVLVISGNDKGKKGKVITRRGDRVIVEGINIRKKHMKAQSENMPARIIDIEKPIHISNVMIASKTDKPVRLKVKSSKEGKKLVYMEDGKEVTHRSI